MDSTLKRWHTSKFKHLQKQGKGVKDPKEWGRIFNQFNDDGSNLPFESHIVDENEEEDENELMEMYEQLMQEDNKGKVNRTKSTANRIEKKKESRNPFLQYGAGIQNYFVL